MDSEYLTKHNMLEAHKQFMRLSEGYLATDLMEDEPNQQQQPEMPPMDGADQQQGAQSTMPDAGMEQQPMGGDMPQGDPSMQDTGAEPPMPEIGAQTAEGDDMLEPEENGDDVLDVEDLTDAQEKLNKKQNELGHDLGDVDNRIVALLTAVEKIQGTIENNAKEIEGLKGEIERRMPTRTEKLNMQSLKMYPFNVPPDKYWAEKEGEGVYQAVSDADENNLKKQYEITNQDVNDFTDREIEDSFDDNEKYRQTMNDIFKGF